MTTVLKGHFASLAAGLIIGIALASSFFAGRIFEKSRETGRPGDIVTSRPSLLLGEIIAISPPHITVKGIGDRKGAVYDVVMHSGTDYMKLLPWEPGERERLDSEIRSKLTERAPGDDGSAIPRPPGEMKAVRWSPDELRIGMMAGIIADTPIRDGEPVTAAAVRELMPDEVSTGQVGTAFPFL